MQVAPVAYFISFRTHGTWLHGDPRGSVHRRPRGQPPSVLLPMPHLEAALDRRRLAVPVRFDHGQRAAVTAAIEEECRFRDWVLHAVAVRVEHVHVVISVGPSEAPEQIMRMLKAAGTQRIRMMPGPLPPERTWSRHGSTRYLWSLAALGAAVRYVTLHEEEGRSGCG